MPSSQLSSDDLRNVKQALLMHNSFDMLIATKLILGWDVFFRNASARFEKKENMRSKFSSRLDVGVLGVHLRAEVAKRRRALRR